MSYSNHLGASTMPTFNTALVMPTLSPTTLKTATTKTTVVDKMPATDRYAPPSPMATPSATPPPVTMVFSPPPVTPPPMMAPEYTDPYVDPYAPQDSVQTGTPVAPIPVTTPTTFMARLDAPGPLGVSWKYWGAGTIAAAAIGGLVMMRRKPVTPNKRRSSKRSRRRA